ncbi:MAG: hypothetical protein HC913_09545 [Microscillaceae bacterium]|nr:hypothetical protein [Microscillaceae bacterium]
MKPIHPLSRLLVALAALSLLATYFLPIWLIELYAPQYPEGVAMTIHIDHLEGDVEKINGLNHYIGMKHIKAEMFPEFTYLPYIVGAFIGLGLLVALFRCRWMLLTYAGLMVAGAVVALADFYLWGYDYGHNLDPTAALKIEGMSYQPPLIGYKKLLNFEAYSLPHYGGLVVTFAGGLVLLLSLFELLRSRLLGDKSLAQATCARRPKTSSLVAGMLLTTGLLWLSACEAQPQPIKFGQDACYHCKMTLMDAKFGAEVVSKKGKVFIFDDVNCMVRFLKMGELAADQVAHQLVVDFARPGTLIPVNQAFFLKSEALQSPMAANIAAFGQESTWQKQQKKLGGEQLSFAQIFELFKPRHHANH